MSEVRVKKSVLQSIIKKYLNESNGKRGDVSRRLTVGPDMSSLPSELPLSPSDRMSTQLEVEMPPVDDPDYVPDNTKELALAVHALAEMVPADHVEKAYLAFKRIIEQLEEEDDSDEEVQIESIRRKNAVLRALVGEQSRSSRRVKGRRVSEARYGGGIDAGEPEPGEFDDIMVRLKGSATANILNDYPDAQRNFGLSDRAMSRVINLEDEYHISKNELRDFLNILDSMSNPDTEIQRELSDAIAGKRGKTLAQYVREFINSNTVAFKKTRAKKKVEKPGEFAWQDYAARMGYAAASGIRQSMIRDVTGVRSIAAYITGKNEIAYINNSILEAFEDGMSDPRNKAAIESLIDEEGLTAYMGILKKNPKLLTHTDFYKNFAGLITYEALSRIAEMSFKSQDGKGLDRPIGQAFQAEFGKETLTNREEKQLEQMNLAGDYSDLVDEVLADAEENNYINLLIAALLMAAEDPDTTQTAAEIAAHEYTVPAFATLKKYSSGKKPPEQAIKDFLGDSPEGEKLAAKVKAARKGK